MVSMLTVDFFGTMSPYFQVKILRAVSFEHVDDVTTVWRFVMSCGGYSAPGGLYSEESFPFHEKLHNDYVVGKCH